MISKEHPFYFVEKLRDKRSIVFQFSKYVYTPDSLFDEREYIEITSDTFSEKNIIELINSLNRDQELAIHSKVVVNGKTFHIPMIDFAIQDSLSSDIMYRIKQLLPKNIFANMAFYDSGRSLHAYSTTLISPKQWIEFMGRLLLVNKKNQEIVDSRWVGHRLLGGYSSLRWSNNSGQYLSEPKAFRPPA